MQCNENNSLQTKNKCPTTKYEPINHKHLLDVFVFLSIPDDDVEVVPVVVVVGLANIELVDVTFPEVEVDPPPDCQAS